MELKGNAILSRLFLLVKENTKADPVPMKFCHKGFLFSDDSKAFEINPVTCKELEVDLTFHWLDQMGKFGTVKDFNDKNFL